MDNFALELLKMNLSYQIKIVNDCNKPIAKTMPYFIKTLKLATKRKKELEEAIELINKNMNI